MTRRRLALGALLVGLLAVTAGCTGFGGGLDEERLARNATYDWNTSATVTVDVNGSEFTAVHEVENGSAVEAFYRDALNAEQTLDVAAVQFRYPNGTVVGVEDVNVTVEDSRVVMRPPAERGQLAYTGPTDPKSFSLPVTTPGSYEVVLPPGMRVENFVFGTVRPGGYERTLVGDRVHLRWEDLEEGTLVVDSYLGRDLYLFAGLIGALVLASLLGVLYFRLQIRELESEREEAGLDVDLEDDDGPGRPPLR